MIQNPPLARASALAVMLVVLLPLAASGSATAALSMTVQDPGAKLGDLGLSITSKPVTVVPEACSANKLLSKKIGVCTKAVLDDVDGMVEGLAPPGGAGAIGSDASVACSGWGANEASANTTNRAQFRPYGDAGWTDPATGNNVFLKVKVCESDLTDQDGYRYVHWMFRHVQNTDGNTGWVVDYNERDRDPVELFDVLAVNATRLEAQTGGMAFGCYTSNGGFGFNLGVSVLGSGGSIGISKSWSDQFCKQRVTVERETGLEARWIGQRDIKGSDPNSNDRSAGWDFGVVTSVLAGTPAELDVHYQGQYYDKSNDVYEYVFDTLHFSVTTTGADNVHVALRALEGLTAPA